MKVREGDAATPILIATEDAGGGVNAIKLAPTDSVYSSGGIHVVSSI